MLQTGGNAYVSGASTYDNGTATPVGDSFINNGSITQSLTDSTLGFDELNVVNAGHITIGGGSEIGLEQSTLTNAGTISIGGTDASGNFAEIYFGSSYLAASPTGFANTGLVTLGVGGALNLDTAGNSLTWSNSGQIAVAGGALDLGGTFTTAQLGSVTVSAGGQVFFDADATDTNTGATLTVGGTAALGTISLYGTIHGGVIADAGGGIAFATSYDNGLADSGDLDAVTYRGMLALAQAGETALVTDGITLTGLAGTGAGAISLSGAGATLDFAGTEKLASTTVSIGAASDGPTLTGGNLTLASDTITQTGAQAVIGNNAGISGAAGTVTITGGHITAAQAGGTLTLAGDIVNAGTIAVSNGETPGAGHLVAHQYRCLQRHQRPSGRRQRQRRAADGGYALQQPAGPFWAR